MPPSVLASQLCPVCSSVLRRPRFVPKTVRHLIREGRRELRLTEAAFALAVGVTRAAVQHWERKDGTSPSRRTAPKVARVLKISLADLLSGGPRPAPQVHRIQSVPLVSGVEAGGFRKIDNFGPLSTLERIEVTVEVRRHTFALQVTGDSMCSSGLHSFPEGTIIVVEPELEPAAGDFHGRAERQRRGDVQAACAGG
jgi:SOS-response transcriptional repressor LexA